MNTLSLLCMPLVWCPGSARHGGRNFGACLHSADLLLNTLIHDRICDLFETNLQMCHEALHLYTLIL
jgi:hypothetical protein